MRTILAGAQIVNVLLDTAEHADLLMEDGRIAAVGDLSALARQGDIQVRDMSGTYLVPGLIDGHIHIESTLMLPPQLDQPTVLSGGTLTGEL